jgi:uncharacterized repeat protein (TIGR03803 family)
MLTFVRDGLIMVGIVIATLIVGVDANTAHAATVNIIYQFLGGTDGATPLGTLAVAWDGTLYGTTLVNFAGSPSHGTVFSLKPPTTAGGLWSKSVLYTFTGGADGNSPVAGPTIKNGTLYGTTSGGPGNVFELRPPGRTGGFWRETTLHSFNGADGSSPRGPNLRIGQNGALYGTTTFAAVPYCCGSVFQLNPPSSVGQPWNLSVLDIFGADNGCPCTGLALGRNGVLYATTNGGTAVPGGSIIEFRPPAQFGSTWTKTVLHYFTAAEGGSPGSLVLGKDGTLYGTNGGVFQLKPPAKAGGAWTLTVLYTFQGVNYGDGSSPSGDLVISSDGSIYGTTQFGGTSNMGTVFRLTPPNQVGGLWQETILHSFAGGTDGAYPGGNDGDFRVGGLVMGPNGALYGTTSLGGVPYSCGYGQGCGTVFEMIP